MRVATWMGHRPSTPDGLPVIGRASRCPEVIYAFGHGHVGLAAAPATAELVSSLVEGTRPGIDVEPYDPRRFRLATGRHRGSRGVAPWAAGRNHACDR